MVRLITIISTLSLVYSQLIWARPGNNPKFDVVSKETHQVQLLEDGAAAFEARLQLIENAQKFVVLETFIYDIDDSGSWIARALVNKKIQNPNVKIRVLIDSVPFRTTIDAFIDKEFKKYGIEVKLYNQHSVFSLSVRNHRKILASEKEVITGSRNIANDYFSMAKENNFIDRDLLIRGPINIAIMNTFENFWNSNESTPIQGIPFPHMDKFRDSSERKFSRRNPLPTRDDSRPNIHRYEWAVKKYNQRTTMAEVFTAPATWTDTGLPKLEQMRTVGKLALAKQPYFEVKDIRFVSDGPDWVKPAETMTGSIMIDNISKTQSKLTIENGYIIPDSDSWKVFEKLMKNGKKIFILTNSRKASKREFTVNMLTLIHARNFAAQGASIYLYSGDPMPNDESPFPYITSESRYNTHAKTYVIDEKSCMIGTANFDPRSLRRMNAEMAIFIEDKNFCQHVESMVLDRARNGHVMKEDGEISPDIDINNIETVNQRFLLMSSPFIRLFERWF